MNAIDEIFAGLERSDDLNAAPRKEPPASYRAPRTFVSHAEKVRRRAKAIENKAAKQEAFLAEHADIAEWLKDNSWSFAQSLVQSLIRYGSLTDNQIAAARRCIARDAERKAQRTAEAAERAAQAQPVNTTALEDAFAKASKRNRRIALWIGSVRVKPAAKHPGVLYVVDRSTDSYLGKVTGGKFIPSRDGKAREAEMLAILADPKAAAVRHGKLTGACSVCNRTLTDPASIQAGIGPVCAENMGW